MGGDAQVVAIMKSTYQFAERTMKKLTLDVTANLIEDTPVDTGWARANWIPQIGNPREDVAGERPSSANGHTGIDVSPQSQGLATVVATYTLDRGSINVTNNVPYITDLNEGTSKQAPAAFVQASIARAVEQNQQVAQDD